MRVQSEEKRKAIFEATIALIAEGGLAGLSMSKIARRSGVPQASVYVYFASKDDLLRGVYDYTEKFVCNYLLEGFDMSQPVRDCFEFYYQRMIELGYKHREFFLAHSQFMASAYSKQLQLGQIADYYEPLYEFVYRGQREGIIKNVAPIVIFSYFSMPLIGIFCGDIIWGNHPEPDWFDGLFEMSWDAVRVQK